MLYQVTLKVEGVDLPPLLELLGPDAAVEIKMVTQEVPVVKNTKRRKATKLSPSTQFVVAGKGKKLTAAELSVMKQLNVGEKLTYGELRDFITDVGYDKTMSKRLVLKGWLTECEQL